jgi:hypothetical protein
VRQWDRDNEGVGQGGSVTGQGLSGSGRTYTDSETVGQSGSGTVRQWKVGHIYSMCQYVCVFSYTKRSCSIKLNFP